MKKILVFDLDGTLIDSKLDLATAVNLTLAGLGLEPIPVSQIVAHVGTGVRRLIEDRLLDVSPERRRTALELFHRHYMDHLTETTALYPGIRDVLDHYEGFEKVILTNKMNVFLEPLLVRLGIRSAFTAVYGLESFESHKPDPLPLRKISQLHGRPPNEMVMIGDSVADVVAGSAAGCETCAVTYGYGRPEDLLELAPTLVVASPLELLNMFSDSYR